MPEMTKLNLDALRAPSRGFWLTALLASLVGEGLAIYLTRLHIALQANPAHQSFCNVSTQVNCDAVTRSGYAVVFGVPLALWGALIYATLALISIWGLRSRRAAPVVPFALLSLFMAAGALALAGISGLVLHNLCLMCACSWLVDALLAVMALLASRGGRFAIARDDLSELYQLDRVRTLGAIGAWVVGLGLVLVVAPKGHPAAGPASSAQVNLPAPVKLKAPVAHGIDDRGHHYVGATQPQLSITEFSDYQCPHCAKAHAQLRQLVDLNPTTLRVVHRHYPLDNACNPAIPKPFHAYSCLYAQLAECAGKLDKFWSANDYLFDHGRDDSPVTPQALGGAIGVDAAVLADCVARRGSQLLADDIKEGMDLKLEGTPTFLVDGKKISGSLPPELLAPFVH